MVCRDRFKLEFSCSSISIRDTRAVFTVISISPLLSKTLVVECVDVEEERTLGVDMEEERTLGVDVEEERTLGVDVEKETGTLAVDVEEERTREVDVEEERTLGGDVEEEEGLLVVVEETLENKERFAFCCFLDGSGTRT